MSKTFFIEHQTHYHYSQKLLWSNQFICLQPQSNPYQTVHEWHLRTPTHPQKYMDTFGNQIASIWFKYPSTSLSIIAQGYVESHGIYRLPRMHSDPKDEILAQSIYLRHQPLTQIDAKICEFAQDVTATPCLEQKMWDLMQAVSRYIRYTPNSTWVHTQAHQAFAMECGVCQDQAHVFLACARFLGIPARYVSGYFFAHNKSNMASHAWVDVFLPKEILSLDITHNTQTHEDHVRIACGADYSSIAPVKGLRLGGGEENMQVDVKITRCRINSPESSSLESVVI